MRSIPASAGQPSAFPMHKQNGKVYPRECGAAKSAYLGILDVPGLSPRVRGSQIVHNSDADGDRSIPASAGQPHSVLESHNPRQVYPRECGAASPFRHSHALLGGLSPRVRGSHRHRRHRQSSTRSIPASAGQPPLFLFICRICRVYPRECGAAISPSIGCTEI